MTKYDDRELANAANALAPLLADVAQLHATPGLSRRAREMRTVQHLRDGLAGQPGSRRGPIAQILQALGSDLQYASSEVAAWAPSVGRDGPTS